MPPVQTYSPLVKLHGVPLLGQVSASACGLSSSNVKEAAIAVIAMAYRPVQSHFFSFSFILVTCLFIRHAGCQALPDFRHLGRSKLADPHFFTAAVG